MKELPKISRCLILHAGVNKKIIQLQRLSISIHYTCAIGVQNSLKRTGHLNHTPILLFQVIMVATLAVMMVLLKDLVLILSSPGLKA